jgi:hypothetical protein
LAILFLNVNDVIDGLVKSYAIKGLGFIGVLAVIITFCSFLANAGMVSLLRSWIDPQTSIQKDVERSLEKDITRSEQRAEILRLRIVDLERQLNALKDQPKETDGLKP